MPRPTQAPRLWLRKPKRAKGGHSPETGGWVIIDAGRQIRTGCRKGDRQEAERALADYITGKHQAPRRERRLHEIPVADVLTIYATDVVPHLATARKAAARIERLVDWWGARMLDDVTGARCRQFAETRSPGAARRELQDLQAAISHHHREGLHRELVRVSLPAAGNARERWLTRSEVARLLRVCLHTPEMQDGEPTGKRPLRHLARFILFALYTGSRPGDVLNAGFFAASDRSVIDLDSALFFRRPSGKAATKKKQPTIPLAPRLMAHLHRWRAGGAMFVVEHHGERIASVKVAFARAVRLAGLGNDVVRYSLRHTAATWMLQRGVSTWEVAGYLGTSEAMIAKHYGHHAAGHLRGATRAMSGKGANATLPQR